jgi:hypothetical protein
MLTWLRPTSLHSTKAFPGRSGDEYTERAFPLCAETFGRHIDFARLKFEVRSAAVFIRTRRWPEIESLGEIYR